MEEDNKKLVDEDGVSQLQKENESFKGKHEELLKEIEEKKEMMEKQLTDKDTAVGSIETQMKEQMETQGKQIREQIVTYTE